MSRLVLIAVFTTALSAAYDQISVANEQQAAQIEAQLKRNPDDPNAREALMAFYANTGDEPDFARHLLWAVENHPEAPAAAMMFYGTPERPDFFGA